MTVRTAERRRTVRTPTVYCATLCDKRNRTELARGRTSNISEGGVFVLFRASGRIPHDGMVCVDLTIPADPVAGTKRTVVYECQITHRQEMGNMVGLGLEFLTKLA